jgi:hypothetical protein
MPDAYGEKWTVVLTENGANIMQNHAFTLILRGIQEVTEEVANALFEAGCEDGTFCARNGVAYVHFDREAPSLDEAIRTALDDVRAAGFDVDRVDSDEFATICHFNRELAEV